MERVRPAFTLRSSRLMMILKVGVVMFNFLKHKPDVPPVGLCNGVSEEILPIQNNR